MRRARDRDYRGMLRELQSVCAVGAPAGAADLCAWDGSAQLPRISREKRASTYSNVDAFQVRFVATRRVAFGEYLESDKKPGQ